MVGLLKLFNWIFNCCRYKKGKLNEKEIEDRALILLNAWKVECYTNNKFLHKYQKGGL